MPADVTTAWAPAAADHEPSPPSPPSPAVKAHDGYRHEAFLWRGEDEFLAGTVPFVLDGLAGGQPVMVAVIQPRIDLLRAVLPSADAKQVQFVDMAEIGRNPARIIPAWRGFIEEQGAAGRPVRGIGEPIWSGRRAAEVTECQMHEALLNLAVDPHTPLWLLCPYDVEGLAPDVVTEAHRSHPALVDVEDYRGSTLYGGSHHVETVFETPLPRFSAAPDSCREFSSAALLAVREDVISHALGAGVPTERSADLALAVHEVAVNSIQHGAGRGVLRIWRDAGALVCEIRDSGRITDPLIGRSMPAWDDESGRGLWMANQLCDLVQVRSCADGTTIRIHTWL